MSNAVFPSYISSAPPSSRYVVVDDPAMPVEMRPLHRRHLHRSPAFHSRPDGLPIKASTGRIVGDGMHQVLSQRLEVCIQTELLHYTVHGRGKSDEDITISRLLHAPIRRVPVIVPYWITFCHANTARTKNSASAYGCTRRPERRRILRLHCLSEIGVQKIRRHAEQQRPFVPGAPLAQNIHKQPNPRTNTHPVVQNLTRGDAVCHLLPPRMPTLLQPTIVHLAPEPEIKSPPVTSPLALLPTRSTTPLPRGCMPATVQNRPRWPTSPAPAASTHAVRVHAN